MLMGFRAAVTEQDVRCIDAEGCCLPAKRARQAGRAGRVSVFGQLKERLA